ncbi:hypothetical protein TanjilG_15737 [Lupinus angustifolius]|uniref:Armadillo repeat-containing domain-containing protein n=1 Tax=Lupinus angustifolius TaxID=3871 RepID=A0A1J7HNH8_LUPAN|nr:PREDICTED: U-box domain-containing protein 45-like [Lupinus angustifolius]OIW14383.1 hypothetical protein TanjilG_15737 [Lupinus angustifolius]
MSNNNNLGSLLIPHHHSKSATTLRLCHSSFRRILFHSITCGSISHRRHHTTPPISEDEENTVKPETRLSEKLSDLLNMEDTETKEEALEEMKKVVKELREEDTRRRVTAAGMVRKVAKEDVEVRETLAMLGVIPSLVAMIDYEEDVHSQIASLYALLNLGIGNDANKAAIVKVGAVQKMLKLIELPGGPNSLVSEAIVANFLGLSALDSNKPIIGSSAAISFLVRTLQSLDDKTSPQAKQDALRALYNLSIFPGNVSCILETDLVHFLVNSIGDMELTERILSILSNLVSTREGRKAISMVLDAFPILVDVLNWTDSPKCQENVSYILMVMAHKSYGDRQAMIEAGIASALLELSLLGTTLAQKRASRILECLRVDKGKQVSGSFGGNLVANVSAPIYGSLASCAKRDGEGAECLEEEEDMMSEEKKAVKQLVQQSLQNNMRKIVKRANLPQDIVPSDHFKSLTSSSTSKSLPF